MNSFVFWLDRPFHPRRISQPIRRKTSVVTIRYSGSFGRSTVKALIVIALLAIMANVVGERATLDLGATDVAAEAVSAGIAR